MQVMKMSGGQVVAGHDKVCLGVGDGLPEAA
jgi:hypothetical protein